MSADQDRFEMPALVEGENAYRVAEFEVSLELLKSVLQMPAESLIIGVRPGDTPYRATLVVKVADPSLPLCPVHRPPMLNPTVTKEQAKWNWNVAHRDGGDEPLIEQAAIRDAVADAPTERTIP